MTYRPIPKKFGIRTTAIVIALLLTTSITIIGQAPHANALAHSTSVAYVTDFGTGLCDPNGPGIGSSVFNNAIISGGGHPTGCPGPGPYTYTTGSNGFGTTASGNTVTLTDVSVSTIDSGGVGVLAPYDTVLLYEVCDIASHPALMTAINSYLTAGGDHKVVILDGDRCSPIAAGSADYNTFLFPFVSSNPGPLGENGTITFVESESSPAVLTRAIPTGPVSGTDAIGDSNTFTSNTGGWCAAQIGENGVKVTGIQTGYARTTTGGLAIWNGWDNWFTFGPNKIDAQMFDNILDQPFNPDKLPCGLPVTGIKLDPLTATNPVGGSHTVTATLTDVNTGKPSVGVTVEFTVSSGPNTGKTGTGVTDASGMTSFTYTDTGGVGLDTIVANFTDTKGIAHFSNSVSKTWEPKQVKITTKLTNSSIAVGQSTNDTATLSNATATAGGTVTYHVYNGTSCTGKSLFNSTVTVTNGIVPNSAPFTPTVPGNYTAQAVYSGDLSNSGAISTCGTEPLNVTLPICTEEQEEDHGKEKEKKGDHDKARGDDKEKNGDNDKAWGNDMDKEKNDKHKIKCIDLDKDEHEKGHHEKGDHEKGDNWKGDH